MEKLKGKALATQVKYFNAEDSQAAGELAALLTGLNVPDVRVVHAIGNSPVLEIWLAENF